MTLANEARTFKESLKVVFAVNRKIVNTAIGRDVAEALAGFGIPILAAAVCQRVAFAESAATGNTVLETAPNSLASQEIMNLAREILGVSQKDQPYVSGWFNPAARIGLPEWFSPGPMFAWPVGRPSARWRGLLRPLPGW